MLTGDANLKNVSGPISIAQFAELLRGGWLHPVPAVPRADQPFLCIMNLLPIPILDGGHLLYYLIEWVKGSPLSDRAQAVGHYLGLGSTPGADVPGVLQRSQPADVLLSLASH